jgi:hypothetical protein
MVHVTSSQRSHEVKAEDGWVDATGCIGAFYPKIVVFIVLGPKGILFFKYFIWVYK